jgi:hypothetical protein
MVTKRLKATKSQRGKSKELISLASLDFESAVRAAMATGRPPKAKQKAKKLRGNP